MIIGQIENGIVLDHITAGKGMKVYNLLGLDKLVFLSYNTTPAEEEKALEVGVRFPALKGFRPHGLTTRFRFFMTTYFGRLLSG